MQGINIVAIGRLKEEYWRAAFAEYEKRLGAYCRLAVSQLPEFRLPDKPTPAQIAQGIREEGERILRALPAEARVVPLCIEGRQLDSADFSRLITDSGNAGQTLAFVIGGSWGLDARVKALGAPMFSFSPMTFPHQLARVMLAEQLYRGFQIAAGGKYHK